MSETRDFDILSPGFHANPFPTLDRIRAEGPFVRMKLPIVGRTWLAVVCFADALVRWFQLLCLTGPLAGAEPKTLRWTLWHAPARLVHHARRHIVRVLDGWPTTAALLDAHRRIALIS